MKHLKFSIIVACIVFTIVVLFASFTIYQNSGNAYTGACRYQVDEITVGGHGYIVATTSTGGIAICKE